MTDIDTSPDAVEAVALYLGSPPPDDGRAYTYSGDARMVAKAAALLRQIVKERDDAEAQAGELKGAIVKLLKRNTELKAQRKKLQEALAPFAKEAKYWPAAPGTTLAYGEVTVGDFRIAHTALGDTNE